MFRRKALVSACLLATSPWLSAHAQDEQTRTVDGSAPLVIQYKASPSNARPSAKAAAPISDAAAWLRSRPEVSFSRMGGHGLDPVVRGQSQQRLSTRLDGSSVQNACPNRMDPATSYASPNLYDQLTVIDGGSSVAYSGASGAQLLYERSRPHFNQADVQGKLGASYSNNGVNKQTWADLAAGGQQGYLRLQGSHDELGDYHDGDGNRVRSAADYTTGYAALGLTPNEDIWLELSGEAVRGEDIKYAGAGMDAPQADADILRLRGSVQLHQGWFHQVNGELYQSRANHAMDNYSLRTPASMKMLTTSSADVWGGRLSGISHLERGKLTLGLDHENTRKQADSFSGMTAMTPSDPSTLQYLTWPDAELEQTGLFAEWEQRLAQQRTFKAGLRAEHFSASAHDGDRALRIGMADRTPDNVYRAVYGDDSKRSSTWDLGGFLRLEQQLDAHRVYGNLSSTVRQPDATELYITRLPNSAMPGMVMNGMESWVGNPNLKSERHNQFELGLDNSGRSGYRVSAFYDRVSDYILRDRARGQDGVLVNNTSLTIYRNVDAMLTGVEGSVWQQLGAWKLDAGLAYTYGRNLDTDRPLAQIAPLEGNVGASWQQAALTLQAVSRFAARQTRVDDDTQTGSAQDAGESSGWITLDLSASYALSKDLTVATGVDNLFDRTYAYHVSRANVDPFNPQAVRVNEPGRSVWLKTQWQF
ncbi:TonB-dependent copper receptor [Atopomonas sediminilitoris]|uniref:TonB-dependent copper receptor n=1 Tax=Atopomonas sediminilitoris TaxID=2919919 RepID=UPI001F4E197D|nr:TonB-dependent copper receptor [Atopomonas sediminilitoris]MCJ8168908.1 TonB-dependent copper receptor [Atopomonas sediminilitoris]